MLRIGTIASLLFSAIRLSAEPVRFDVCKESATWTRPTATVQAKIWRDPRYAGLDHDKLWEWTHSFIVIPVDSASIPYHTANTSGLWTEGTFDATCDGRKSAEWIGVWVLFHRVRSIESDNGTYTIHVDPTAKGFQSITVRRSKDVTLLKFVDANGTLLDSMAPPF